VGSVSNRHIGRVEARTFFQRWKHLVLLKLKTLILPLQQETTSNDNLRPHSFKFSPVRRFSASFDLNILLLNRKLSASFNPTFFIADKLCCLNQF
jgi:hypothetical protein